MRAPFLPAFVGFAILSGYAAPAQQAGTATLSGTLVTEGAAPQPVRRATVRLAGAPGTSARLVGTDDQGRFVFGGLQSGSFTLSATKAGYVAAFYGSTRPGRGPGVPIAVAGGQRIDVTMQILPGAAISGTIRDRRGHPVPSVAVVATEIRAAGSATAPPARATTDDRGVYRVFGLAPGEYVLSAVPRLPGAGTAPMSEVLGVTDADVQWAQALSGVTADPRSSTPPRPRPVAYAPVYYPGTTSVNGAARVSVAAGEERADVNFSIAPAPIAMVGGTLVDYTGQPLNVTTSVSLYPRTSDQAPVVDALVATGALKLPAAGVSVPSFWIVGVAPGDYTLVARTGSPGRASPDVAPAQWSVTDITIDGRDQPDLLLRLQPGVQISGSIVFEGSTQPSAADPASLDISLVAANPRIVGPVAPQATLDPSGRFVFLSVLQGKYTLRAKAPLAEMTSWILKSAMLNGRDLADVPVDVNPGQNISGVVVTFAERGAEVSGRLLDSSGQPVTRYSIVVFTVDQSLWLAGARRVRSTKPSGDGAFSVAGLPAGEYAIAAADGIEPSDLADPAFLMQLLASAHRITLGEGEKKTQDLLIRRPPEP